MTSSLVETEDEIVGGDVDEFFSTIRQGDWLDNSARRIAVDCDRVVVISQTCDVVLGKRPTILVAALRELEHQDATEARRRDNPRYVELAGHGFADLCHVTSIEKPALLVESIETGLDQEDDSAVRVFSLGVGRWFSRFAVPDDVVPWLRPLQDAVRSKYDKPDSSLGQILHKVAEIRVEADRWTHPVRVIRLHVIVKAGEIPTYEEPPPMSDAIARKLRLGDDEGPKPSEIAELLNADLTPDDKHYAWLAFAKSLASLCRPKPSQRSDPIIAAAVREVVGELWSDDEFPLSRVRKSEIVDLDYLSEPTPL